MVNKKQVLNIVRDRETFVPGEEMAALLGISRVGVWKHIQGLRELGYKIKSAKKGYRYLSSPDKLFPFEFPAYEKNMRHFETADSSMSKIDYNSSRDFSLALAEVQTRGRGRRGRSWQSCRGGIYLTLGLRARLPMTFLHRYSLMACLSVAEVIRENYNLESEVKWPNDVLLEGKKVAGILVESSGNQDRLEFVKVGIGINANNDSWHIPRATSLKKELARSVDRSDLLTSLLDKISQERKNMDSGTVINKAEKLFFLLNRQVTIKQPGKIIGGKVLGLASSGALLIKKKGGGKEKVFYGDVKEYGER